MGRRASSLKGINGSDRQGIKTSTIILVILCAAVFASIGCKKPEQKVTRERAVNVRVWEAETRSVRPFVESVGTLKAYDSVIVSSELDGILNTIHVDEGAPVKRQQLIAEIKETDYRLAMEQAAAILKQAEATLANTRLEYQRKEALFKEELVTKQQFDDVNARLAVTLGDVERAKAGLDLAREKMTKTKIFAPMSGVVNEKKVTEGDYIRNGTPLVSIVRTDQLKLVFSVTEKNVGTLKEGQDIAFTVDAFPGKEFRGKVRTIYPTLEEKTRSLQVEAVVQNEDQRLKPGFFARVTLFIGPLQDVVVAPITSLQYDNTLVKIFVVEDKRAKERKVEIGRKYGEFIEITEGLKRKDVVVVVGQNNLMEGVLVNVAR